MREFFAWMWTTSWFLLQGLGGIVILLALLALLYYLGSRGLDAARRQERINDHLRMVLEQLLRWTLVVVAVLAVLQWFRVLEDAWTLITTVLALVAIGFVASWSVLSNVLCSLILMIARPFQVGDTVELTAQGLRGKVKRFDLLFTTLEAEGGDLIRVPNNAFFQGPFRCRPGDADVPLEEVK